MPIDRRTALRLFTLGTSPIAVTVRADGDLYVNRRLELSVRKPHNWHFLSLVDHWNMSAEQLKEFSPAALKALDAHDAAPIVVIGESRPDAIGFNPSVTIYDEAANNNHESALVVLTEGLPDLSLFAKQMHVDEKPYAIQIKGNGNSARCAWSYAHPTGTHDLRVCVTTILVLRGQRMQTFHFFRPQNSPEAVSQALQDVEESIEYHAET
jgi:hypothetical protein